MTVTSDELLTGVQRRISQPAVRALLSNTDMLAMADDCIRDTLIPLLKSVSQNYFVTKSEETIVGGTKNYSIPYRALGRTLRDLKLVDSGDNVSDLSLISLEDEHMFSNASSGGGVPVGFFFYGDQISLVPTPASSLSGYSLEKWWELPPGQLVVTSEAAEITSIAASPAITVSSVPSTITTGTVVDIIQGKQGCRTLAMDVTIVSVVGTTITFSSSDIPAGLAVGDYICLPQESPVVQLPDEAYPLLETKLGANILSAVGDFEGAGRLEKDAKEQEKNLKMILEPRITGEETKIVNRRGLLWNRWGRRLPGRAFW
jgi:hypothetical protein